MLWLGKRAEETGGKQQTIFNKWTEKEETVEDEWTLWKVVLEIMF